MEVKVSNFGDILMSRPAGREAFLKAKAYVFKDIKTDEIILLDFDKVKVLAPSWADEFIYGIQKDYVNEVQYINTENPSVKASLKTVIGHAV
jgi:Fe-S cluster assembly iron-binding protein IscA